MAALERISWPPRRSIQYDPFSLRTFCEMVNDQAFHKMSNNMNPHEGHHFLRKGIHLLGIVQEPGPDLTWDYVSYRAQKSSGFFMFFEHLIVWKYFMWYGTSLGSKNNSPILDLFLSVPKRARQYILRDHLRMKSRHSFIGPHNAQIVCLNKALFEFGSLTSRGNGACWVQQ